MWFYYDVQPPNQSYYYDVPVFVWYFNIFTMTYVPWTRWTYLNVCTTFMTNNRYSSAIFLITYNRANRVLLLCATASRIIFLWRTTNAKRVVLLLCATANQLYDVQPPLISRVIFLWRTTATSRVVLLWRTTTNGVLFLWRTSANRVIVLWRTTAAA